ncbi:MAG: sugar ABC transporter permease [Cellulomonas sp.]|uniref:Xylose transport system permease protein XylH n=1 Tax=Cellulomonas gelida TaxID=1712 RepID=A0A4Y3KJ37_9CELL|nr:MULTISPECIES: multiple monosaccharide ABC transporter permease [Cellulomonas]KMM44895.1 sugar ABC transporter permease [Cellulomonas sp. A375-1]MCR6646840.1 sugar ABC transporter permease [Cellulomonas sp.]MCR6706365.1 sugar ABC transporter permease [Cellulomonas sp.]GEA83115.1 ABC transporter permease [Cellulomonas gelida]GGL30065.1 ABC transporter permease [Cellulomonas gelida]
MSTDTNLAPAMPPGEQARIPLSQRLSGLGGNARQYGIFAALIVIILLFQGLTDGRLLKPDNVVALFQQNAYVMVLAIGMVMVIVAGHIDLSVGSVVAVVGGIIAVSISDWGLPWWLAVILGVVIGAAIGAWQGFWIAYVGIPAFIVTLAGMLIFRGLALVVVGQTIRVNNDSFNSIVSGSLPNFLGFTSDMDVVTLVIGALTIAAFAVAQLRARMQLRKHDLHVEALGLFIGKLVAVAVAVGFLAVLLSLSAGGMPIILVIVGVLIVVYTFLMGRTVFGRHIYAVGGNRPAASLSGVRTKRVDFMIFVNIGALAGIAAIITTARGGAAVAAAGQNFELDAIAACFIGGAAVTGGIGRISGAIVGALIMGVLNMGLSIMSVDPSWQQAIKGLVLLAAVAFDLINKRRAGTS